MAEKRMLSSKITDHDNFTTLPASAQALYLHLVLSADDDGFCAQTNSAMLKAHAKKKDLEELVKRRYLIRFDSGVYAVKHWKMQNTIRPDRYHETEYKEEKALLSVKPNGAYTTAKGQPNDGQADGKMSAEPQPNDGQSAAEPQPNDNNPQPQYLGLGLGLGLDTKDSVCNTRASEGSKGKKQQDKTDPDRWEEFWDAYPRKSGGDIRSACLEYLHVIDSGVEPETLIKAAEALAAKTTKETERYLPSAEKWLRNKAWMQAEFQDDKKEPQKTHIPAETPPEKRVQPVNLVTDVIEWPPGSGEYRLKSEVERDAHR